MKITELVPNTAIHLTRLPRYHKDGDRLAEYVPERNNCTFALHPDRWESTFFSLTNKDPRKLKYYGPVKIAITDNTLIGDMALANKFYRAKSEDERVKYAQAYRDSLRPYNSVDITKYRLPELLIPKS